MQNTIQYKSVGTKYSTIFSFFHYYWNFLRRMHPLLKAQHRIHRSGTKTQITLKKTIAARAAVQSQYSVFSDKRIRLGGLFIVRFKK